MLFEMKNVIKLFICYFYIIYSEIIKNKMLLSTFEVNMLKKNHKKSNFCMVQKTLKPQNFYQHNYIVYLLKMLRKAFCF
jgi:hypothetical protein